MQQGGFVVVPLCGLVVEFGVSPGFGVVAGFVVPGVVVVAPGFGVVAPGFGVVAPGFDVVAPTFEVVALGPMVVPPACGAVLPAAGAHGLLAALVPGLVVVAEPDVETDGVLLTEPFALVPGLVLAVLEPGAAGALAEAVVPGAAAEPEALPLTLGVQGAVVVVLDGDVVVGDIALGLIVPDVVVVPPWAPAAGELPGSDVVPLFGNVLCGVPGCGIVPFVGVVVLGADVCGALMPGGGCVPAPVA